MPTAFRLAGLDGVLWFFALFPLVDAAVAQALPGLR